jgi:membrane protein implicated in regulation of membrane protease activity
MFSFEWWHWTVLGLALTMAEMAIPGKRLPYGELQ